MNHPSNAGFGPVLAVRSLLSDLSVPYWIAGGWAIDLAVGRVTRDHADVDIMLLERDEHALRILNAEQRSWLQDTLEHLPRGQTAPVPRR